ncbi:MAG: DUF1565 domain-containing protein [Phycisphaerae bacterium]|nr:DUF1565 domain-containing protein [Phycisphaerae bacterium]NIP56060.1 DUF1565 domain-containing protein [Phycisphaerae bacterium]NIS50330.1 DUF1565 domain-containing protein [Phycisphaerae bacterium]NIU08077.1 DUF1565 domain-containing protein [Phycisphaerae bacterium]NIU59976.1 DUF1565 domain-containing protein [Phycisphaerae bacterium]
MRSARNLKAQVVISIFLVLLGGTASAGRIIKVPLEFDNIQAAIDDANDGDMILVSIGTYRGQGNRDIDFAGKAIRLCSTDPNDPNIVAATIIDCNGSEGHCHRGFYFHSGEDANSVVKGLTITNGFHGRGGGILCIASSPIIRNNIITGNKIEYDADGGGGIGCWDGASPLIVGNTISDNHCEPGGGGGGICCRRASSPTITDNIIAGNSASQGSGILCYGSPTISNCTFHGNTTLGMGGGILIDGSPILTNCTFNGNSAGSGGAIYNYQCSPTLTNCRFIDNSAQYSGGGMYNSESSPVMTDCNFSGNSAAAGGGMYNMSSGPTLRNCSFIANSAHTVLHYGGSGGGIYTVSYSGTGHPEVVNCVFEGNSAASGGGISSGGELVVTDCIFNKNKGGGIRGTATELKGCSFTSNQGGGIFIGSDSHLSNCLFTGNIGGGLQAQDCDIVITNCSFIGNITSAFFAGIWNDEGDTTVTNCISWGNISKDGVTESAQIATHDPAVINYCCIQGWTGALGGTGNIGADPCFVSEGYWDALPDFNDDYWERHIRWSGGDYHLKSQAGRWDANKERWTKDDVTSSCIDAGDMAGPIGLEPFPNGGVINMGVYGGTAEASKSYFGERVCETIVAGDINGDCIVNSVDFALMAAHWLENNSP